MTEKEDQKREYWVVSPEEKYSGRMKLRTFLKRKGYRIKKGVILNPLGSELGQIDKEDAINIEYDSSDIELGPASALDSKLYLIEILEMNGVEYTESPFSRENLIVFLKSKTREVIRMLEKSLIYSNQ